MFEYINVTTPNPPPPPPITTTTTTPKRHNDVSRVYAEDRQPFYCCLKPFQLFTLLNIYFFL